MFCPQCGKEIIDGQTFCQFCGGRTDSPAPAGRAGRVRTPWEDREQQGGLRGLGLTIKGSLLDPTRFFRSMNVTGGLSDPLLYAMITAGFGIMASYVWQILFQQAFTGFLPAERAGAGIPALPSSGLAVIGLLLPFIVIIVIFLTAGMQHLLMLMVRGANGGFEATFRAVAYSYGAYLFMAVPFCGSLIATVWSIIVVIIGLKEAHGTSGGKAAFAVLFPLVLCCAAVMLIMLAIFGSMAASFGAMKPVPWK